MTEGDCNGKTESFSELEQVVERVERRGGQKWWRKEAKEVNLPGEHEILDINVNYREES